MHKKYNMYKASKNLKIKILKVFDVNPKNESIEFYCELYNGVKRIFKEDYILNNYILVDDNLEIKEEDTLIPKYIVNVISCNNNVVTFERLGNKCIMMVKDFNFFYDPFFVDLY